MNNPVFPELSQSKEGHSGNKKEALRALSVVLRHVELGRIVFVPSLR